MFFLSFFISIWCLKLGQATQRCAESHAAMEELKPESLVFNQLPRPKRRKIGEKLGKIWRNRQRKMQRVIRKFGNWKTWGLSRFSGSFKPLQLQILLCCRFHHHFSPRPFSDLAGRDSNLSKDCCDCTSPLCSIVKIASHATYSHLRSFRLL